MRRSVVPTLCLTLDMDECDLGVAHGQVVDGPPYSMGAVLVLVYGDGG